MPTPGQENNNNSTTSYDHQSVATTIAEGDLPVTFSEHAEDIATSLTAEIGSDIETEIVHNGLSNAAENIGETVAAGVSSTVEAVGSAISSAAESVGAAAAEVSSATVVVAAGLFHVGTVGGGEDRFSSVPDNIAQNDRNTGSCDNDSSASSTDNSGCRIS